MDKKSQIIRNVSLAKIMAEYDNSYHLYEYKDFLEIFTEVITQLVSEGKEVQLEQFGTFSPKSNPAKRLYSPLKNIYVDHPSSMGFRFIVSRVLNAKVKDCYIKKETEDEATKN